MKRQRRLLSVAHSYVVSMNRRLAHELARVGGEDWEVTAVAPTYFHGGNDLRPVQLDVNGEEPCRLVPVRAYLTRRIHVFFYGRRLRSLLAEPWDLVHCWEEPYIVGGGQVAWWAPRRTPLIYRTAQSLDKAYPIPFRWIERYAMQRAAGWICSGSLVAQTLGARPGYADRPRAQIPLGVDVNCFGPDPAARTAIRRQLGWDPAGAPVVGYLGRFVAEKGIELLQRVFDRLATPWRALFVGAGPGEAALRRWAEPHADRVRICTDVTHNHVPAYLNAMDVLCAPSQTTPSWKEQFGRMVIEAFASGLAFIGSDSGEIPHVVQDAGVIVGEADEAGWVEAIGRLLADPVRRGELAARGLQRAHDEFAWPVVARRYLDFFDAILDGGRAHAQPQYAASARDSACLALMKTNDDDHHPTSIAVPAPLSPRVGGRGGGGEGGQRPCNDMAPLPGRLTPLTPASLPPQSGQEGTAKVPRLALLRDYREEAWPSMELCAEMLAEQLHTEHSGRLTIVDDCPPFRQRLQRLPWLGRRRAALNGDRLLNRLWDYPRHVRRLAGSAELFHVVDHSYAQLVHALPAGRTGVYCHDLDTFRCILDPATEKRPRWFRAMARRILDGLQRAAVVFHSTAAVRAAIERHGLVDARRLVCAPLGCAPEFLAEPAADAQAAAVWQQAGGTPYLLHVGSCIPRKRIDVVLETAARLRARLPELRLVKVGGEWTAEQRALLARPALAGAVVHVTGISRLTLACLYRRARLVLMPSAAEGFGLPVLEALACGAPVLASDLPVFREIGGAVVRYVAVGDVDAWADAALALLQDAGPSWPRVARAEGFSWQRHARIIADTYRELAR